jgi:hypothetical protein
VIVEFTDVMSFGSRRRFAVIGNHIRPHDRMLYVGGYADAFFHVCPNSHPGTVIVPHAAPILGPNPGGPFDVVVLDRFVEFLSDSDVLAWAATVDSILADNGKLLLAVSEMPVDPYAAIDWSCLGNHLNLHRLADPARSAAMFESPLLARQQTHRVGRTWTFILQRHDPTGDGQLLTKRPERVSVS